MRGTVTRSRKFLVRWRLENWLLKLARCLMDRSTNRRKVRGFGGLWRKCSQEMMMMRWIRWLRSRRSIIFSQFCWIKRQIRWRNTCQQKLTVPSSLISDLTICLRRGMGFHRLRRSLWRSICFETICWNIQNLQLKERNTRKNTMC